MRILLETDNAIVSFDESRKAMAVMWSAAAENEEFYLVYNHVLKGFKIYFANTLILDFRKYDKLANGNLDFLIKQVFPMSIKCGLRKLVLINMESHAQRQISNSLDTMSFSHKIAVENAVNFEEAVSKLAV